MSREVDVERRIRGLRDNYLANALYRPMTSAKWSDIVRDLDEALGDLVRSETPPLCDALIKVRDYAGIFQTIRCGRPSHGEDIDHETWLTDPSEVFEPRRISWSLSSVIPRTPKES